MLETSDMKDKIVLAGSAIKKAGNVLVVTHVRPDGDCLSSACALSLWLESLGKKHSLFCADPVPDHYRFLPGSGRFTDRAGLDFHAFDLIAILDCACLSRSGLADELVQKKTHQTIIEIDHHPKSDICSDIEIRWPEKSSTAELLHLFFTVNGVEMDKRMADCLLTGLITDTGNLLFSSVNEDTIKTSSALLLEGATMPKIIKNTGQNKGLSAMKVWGKVMESLSYNSKYDIAYAVVTWEEMDALRKEFGKIDAAFDAVSDILNNVEGAKAALFLREEEPGKIKGSLRSKYPGMDIARLAEFLGGGGHPKAAAFRFDGHIVKDGNSWKIV